MSDTPRTDAETKPPTSGHYPAQYVSVSFARTLERELAELTAHALKLRDYNVSITNDRDAWHECAEKLARASVIYHRCSSPVCDLYKALQHFNQLKESK